MFEFLQAISDFLQVGIYSWWEDAMQYMISTLLISYIKAQIWGVTMAWEVGQQVLSGFQVTQKLSYMFSILPPDVQKEVNLFRIPEAINILISGLATRWVLSMVPFFS